MEAVVASLLGITFASAAAAVISYQRAKSAREELSRLNNFDRLTGLPNRNQLRGWLDDMLKQSRRNTSRVAVFFVELNQFAYLNDTYGHEVGDALMVAAARALRAIALKGELLVRFGGPQFVVAVPDVPDPTQANKRAAQILDAVQRQYEIGRDRIRLSANVGIVLTNQQYVDAESVLLDASVALRHAASMGKGSICMFDASLRSQLSPSAAEHRLREALDRGQFWLLYLPVVDLRDPGRLVGMEALLRWADPDTGLVSPRQFLRSLDETGLIVPVGTWVLGEACRQAKRWQEEFGDKQFEMTVNVSPRQLMQGDFVETVTQAIRQSGVDPQKICLEIAESSLMSDTEAAWSALRQIKSLGVKLSLDDFGTGHSSLGNLRQFDLDTLKIDRDFVEHVARGGEDTAIVSHIVGLAHALHMRALAEGVETAEQVRALAELGCDRAQGYYFSMPQPADVIARSLERGRLDPADQMTPSELASAARATIVPPDLR